MKICQNCGKHNDASTNFCRFCGTRFGAQVPKEQPVEYRPEPPRPYAWKTDEYSTSSPARQTAPGHIHSSAYAEPAPLVHVQPQYFGQVFRCPACQSTVPPRMERRISTGGWITFAALLIFFFPLFWIGLLIKEDVLVCQTCNSRLSTN